MELSTTSSSLNFLLTSFLLHETRIRRRTAFDRLEVPIHGALDATGEDVDCLWRMLIEELASSFAYKTAHNYMPLNYRM